VILADACHSAAIGGAIGRRMATNDAQVINTYLQGISKAKAGVALLTSAETSETAQEHEKWNGGHGVFTYFLLEGMKGGADGYGRPKDGMVTVGELFDYVRENVKKATNNLQHPSIGTNRFDRDLLLAVTGAVNAKENYQIGNYLCNIGYLLDDQARFRDAAKQYKEAIRLSKTARIPLPVAELGLGKALIALGDYESANDILSELIEQKEKETLPEAILYQGIVLAKKKEFSAAIRLFESFVETFPERNETIWVKEYLTWLNNKGIGKKHALLIGINNYMFKEVIFPLNGCINDINEIKKVLINEYDFEEDKINSLTDQFATREKILSAFAKLIKYTLPGDTVIVHFSGHSIPESYRRPESFGVKTSTELYIIVYDTKKNSAGQLINGISPQELHELMNKIPAENKTLILDTHPNNVFIDMAKKNGNYTLLLASDSAEIAFESHFNSNGKSLTMGLFTGVLVQELYESKRKIPTNGTLLDGSLRRIRNLGFNQTPLLIGDRDQLIFVPKEIYLTLFDFSKRRNYSVFTIEGLIKSYSRFCTQIRIPFPEVLCSFGHAFLEKHDYHHAIESLSLAIKQREDHYQEARFLLGKAQFFITRYGEALYNLRTYDSYLSEEKTKDNKIKTIIENIEKIIVNKKYAVLVGINEYISKDVKPLKGAVNDVLAFQEVLIKRFNFKNEDIILLLDGAATRSAVLNAFKEIVTKAQNGAALFYFAGIGSINYESKPTIVCSDSRLDEVHDIGLDELSILSRESPNLVTILDAEFARYSESGDMNNNNRSIAGNTRDIKNIPSLDIAPTVSSKKKGKRSDENSSVTTSDQKNVYRNIKDEGLRIGGLTIYPRSISHKFYDGNNESELEMKLPEETNNKKFHGKVTYSLISSLYSKGNGITNREWFESSSSVLSSEPTFIVLGNSQEKVWSSPDHQNLGSQLNEIILENVILRDAITQQLTEIEQESIIETIWILRRLIEQKQQHGEQYPEGHLNLGIAYSLIGKTEEAILELENAVSLYSDYNIMELEKEKDSNAEDYYFECHFQLGKILFESKNNLTKAVSNLEEATKTKVVNSRFYYYLGKAYFALAEEEIKSKGMESLKLYLDNGAPLGYEEDVRRLLGSKKDVVSR
jgi:tetratricopeptide (TPR) repeat protein